ncbi:hypothetical protein Tco_0974927, partial [Tanacetum coccineum]
MGMDWLSMRKFVIVCYEKVVRIPLEGDEILRVHRERTLGAAKALINAKIDEPWTSVITLVRDFTDVFPENLLGLPPQRQVEFRIDLSKEEHEVHLKLVLESIRKDKLYAKFFKSNVVGDDLSINEKVKPRRVRGMILAAQSEAFKQEN